MRSDLIPERVVTTVLNLFVFEYRDLMGKIIWSYPELSDFDKVLQNTPQSELANICDAYLLVLLKAQHIILKFVP